MPTDTVPRHDWRFRADTLLTADKRAYMTRYVFQTPYAAVRLHRIFTSDDKDAYHDHPFDFATLILSGRYIEHRADGLSRVFGPGSARVVPAATRHRLELPDGTVTTLVLAGPIFRLWYFYRRPPVLGEHPPPPPRPIPFREYLADHPAPRIHANVRLRPWFWTGWWVSSSLATWVALADPFQAPLTVLAAVILVAVNLAFLALSAICGLAKKITPRRSFTP